MMEDKTVDLFCNHDHTVIQHLANHLENEGIDFQITGDTSTSVLGIYNATQMVCIRVYEKDLEKATKILAPYLPE